MFAKTNIRFWLILFIILAGIAVVITLVDRKKGERSFRKELFDIDSAEVTSVSIYPKGKMDQGIQLQKEGNKWQVRSQKESYPADTNFIRNLLQTLRSVKPEGVMGIDPSSWNDFQVSDTTGTHVLIEQGKKVSADFTVGRVSFSQPPQQMAGRNRNPIVKSHIRVADDDKVYLVDGYLSLMFPAQESYYRNKTLCKFRKELATQLTFTYPGDSSFTVQKINGHWLLDGLGADSAAMETYLRGISTMNGTEFADESSQAMPFLFKLRIDGDNMPFIEIHGAKAEPAKLYFVKSSVNPTATFKSNTPQLFNRIFAGKKKFR